MTKPKLVLVGDGTPAAPFESADERAAAAQEAWRSARARHLQLLAKVNSPSMLRLHNAGSLPHEDRASRNITSLTLTGLVREMREVEDLADQAAMLLELAAMQLRER